MQFPYPLEKLQQAAARIAERHRRLAILESAHGQPQQALWQRWQEQEGRWVPRDTLPPGYGADPPPWDPLPGEVLQTPAFPLEDFGAIQP